MGELESDDNNFTPDGSPKASPPLCRVHFRVCCSNASSSEQIVVVGSDTTLGAWQPAASQVQLFKDEEGSPWWRGCSAFPSDVEIDFKFAIMLGNGTVRWEDGIGNRKILTQPGTMLLGANFDCQEFIQMEFIPSRGGAQKAVSTDSTAPAASDTSRNYSQKVVLSTPSAHRKLDLDSSLWSSCVVGS